MYDMFDDGYCDCNPRDDWENEILEIVKDTIDKKYKEILDEKEYLSKQLSEKSKELIDKKEEVKKLKNDLNKFEDFKLFLEIINKDNIVGIIEGLNLPVVNDDRYISGMDSKEISPYIKLIVKYYNNKDLIIKLLKIVGVDNNIKNLEYFILPRDYNKELIEDILKNIDRRTIQTNCCCLKDNFGFWLRGIRDASTANLSKTVPLQEVFKSKYIVELFDILVELLKKSETDILEITKYQKFNDSQILEMSKYIRDKNSNGLYETEADFIKRHKDILFNNNEFCEKYYKYIVENQYSTFSVYNFNKEYQIKYLKKISFKNAIEIINRMEYSDEIKKEMIKAISNVKILDIND